MPDRDLGVLPNDVHRDPRAEAAFVFVNLADGLDEAAVQSWLTTVRDLVNAAESHQGREVAYASVVIALGQRFFNRFPDRQTNNPAGLKSPPMLPPEAENLTSDVLLHITFTSEARLADLLKGLWATRHLLAGIEVERGYARNDEREAFGHLDGLRNLTSAQRRSTTSIDLDLLPEEASWLAGACYLAYLKIEQNMEAFAALGHAAQEQVMGRRTGDGSRLDLPEGTNPHTEENRTTRIAPRPDPDLPPRCSLRRGRRRNSPVRPAVRVLPSHPRRLRRRVEQVDAEPQLPPSQHRTRRPRGPRTDHLQTSWTLRRRPARRPLPRRRLLREPDSAQARQEGPAPHPQGRSGRQPGAHQR
jgi:hypothetical protein